MTESRRRRRRTVLVPVLGLGVAAWAVHRKLGGRYSLDEGWQPLPPAPSSDPVARRTSAGPVIPSLPDEPSSAAAPATVVAAEPVASVEPAAPAEEAVLAEPAPQAAEAEPQAVEPEPLALELEPEPLDTVERPRVRTVAAAAAVASVTAPALPDAPFGPGSLRALDDGSSPDPAYTVKGKSGTKVFHVPGGAYYTRTRADVWFRTARDARGAGFTERTRKAAERG